MTPYGAAAAKQYQSSVEFGTQSQGRSSRMGRTFSTGPGNHEAAFFDNFFILDHAAFGKNYPVGFTGQQGFDN